MWVAISSGILFLFAVLGLQWKLQTIRRARLQDVELRPNCLLTRHPIIFVGSRRSLFRIFEPWNEIPGFLREHGYEVFVLEPRFTKFSQGSKSVTAQIRAALDALAQGDTGPLSKFHLIAESSIEDEWIKLAAECDSRVATLTLAVRQATRVPQTEFFQDRTKALKPLASSIVELPLDQLGTLLQRSRGWSRVAVLLLRGHNFMLRVRSMKIGVIDPIAVGQILSPNWLIESQFLDRAIELAERDAQFSD